MYLNFFKEILLPNYPKREKKTVLSYEDRMKKLTAIA